MYRGPVPYAKDTPIAVSDVALAIATIMLNPSAHVNKTYTVAGKFVTPTMVANTFAKAIGKPVFYYQITYELAAQAFLAMGFLQNIVDGKLLIYCLGG